MSQRLSAKVQKRMVPTGVQMVRRLEMVDAGRLWPGSIHRIMWLLVVW